MRTKSNKSYVEMVPDLHMIYYVICSVDAAMNLICRLEVFLFVVHALAVAFSVNSDRQTIFSGFGTNFYCNYSTQNESQF